MRAKGLQAERGGERGRGKKRGERERVRKERERGKNFLNKHFSSKR